MAAVLVVGSVDPKVVAVEARRFADGAVTGTGSHATITTILEHSGERPAPGLAGYDELLEEVAG
jgi:hypothetical protein